MKKNIYLILIILTGVILILLYGTKKQIYDGDELYSYSLSNSKKHGFMINNIKLNEWNSKEEIKDIFALNNDEIFSFLSVYKNQARDVHPPFYYALFHIISILFLNKFSILPGLILNIISYIILMIYLYKISEQILPEKEKYIPCILYTISLGMISTAMFIRMYMLLTAACVAFTYYFLCITKEMNKKNLIKLSICTYIGFMTHYFFLVYAFFISLIYLIHLIIKKKNIITYTKTILIPIITGFITFPFAYIHIFKGYRGEETQDNLVKSNIVENFKNIYDRFNKDIFYNMMPIIILITLILIIILLKKNYKKIKNNVFMITLLIGTILYFILTLKIIPILSTRYFYPIYPLIFLIIYYIISKSINNKYIKIGITTILIILSITTQIKYEPSWISQRTSNNIDKNVIYVIKDDYTTISESQFLMDYNKIYYTNENFDNYEIIENSDKDVIIKTDNIKLLENIIKNTKYTEYEQQGIGYILK